MDVLKYRQLSDRTGALKMEDRKKEDRKMQDWILKDHLAGATALLCSAM